MQAFLIGLSANSRLKDIRFLDAPVHGAVLAEGDHINKELVGQTPMRNFQYHRWNI
jgi:hypothetical protein